MCRVYLWIAYEKELPRENVGLENTGAHLFLLLATSSYIFLITGFWFIIFFKLKSSDMLPLFLQLIFFVPAQCCVAAMYDHITTEMTSLFQPVA